MIFNYFSSYLISNKKFFFLIGFICLFLSACATQKVQKKQEIIRINHISKPIHKVVDADAFKESGKYLYEPPRVYRTWINSRATQDNQVVSAHYRYWVSSKGHWNVPLEAEHGQKEEMFTPSAG